MSAPERAQGKAAAFHQSRQSKKLKTEDYRKLAGKKDLKRAEAQKAIVDLCDKVEEQRRKLTHLHLRSKPPKQKALGIGETYGVG